MPVCCGSVFPQVFFAQEKRKCKQREMEGYCEVFPAPLPSWFWIHRWIEQLLIQIILQGKKDDRSNNLKNILNPQNMKRKSLRLKKQNNQIRFGCFSRVEFSFSLSLPQFTSFILTDILQKRGEKKEIEDFPLCCLHFYSFLEINLFSFTSFTDMQI